MPQGTAEKRQAEDDYQAALKEFEAAVRLFHKQKFDKAKEIFEKLMDAPVREVADRARVHTRICEQKLSAAGRAPAAKTAEDYYNLGIIELNNRAFDVAMEHLTKADKMAPDQEHIRYALAALHALQGNKEAALEHLGAAIQLRSENRLQARRDEDFKSLENDPRFKQLVRG